MTAATSPKLYVDEMWSVFNEPGPLVIEVRSIWPKDITPIQRTLSRCFDSEHYYDLAAFRLAVEAYVTEMNQRGYNMYATLNPLRSGLSQSHCAVDKDVTCRRRLLIDIDRDQGKEHPASDAQIQAAWVLADQINRYFNDLGWPNPVRVMSGNGYHLVYPLDDLPNTDEVTHAVRELLRNLKEKFSGNGLSVDTSVSNASRVTKLPGTLARRGIEIENHPYRVARIYE
ncbi:hypothetical protein [Limnohabitans radicicola]|uniref:Uncharacterized protein n=1 Tax=Limnohabitans radicicola TaxID=2771427 RepID=A0A927FKC8_9BURK|nr:hypothetical protein [Limnohabitans radicicola]MBD8052037.1 hypothetical protein [Limnohabitans radicicola]